MKGLILIFIFLLLLKCLSFFFFFFFAESTENGAICCRCPFDLYLDGPGCERGGLPPGMSVIVTGKRFPLLI